MAGFITLLLVVIGQFGGSDLGVTEMSAQISKALLDAQPVPMEAVDAVCALSEAGEIDSIEFKITGLVLDPLKIDHAIIHVEGIDINGMGKVGLSAVSWEVQISDADLSNALSQHTSSISDANISTTDDGISVEGNYPLWKVNIPFSLEGGLVVQNQTHLVFKLETSGVGQVTVPHKLTKLLEQEINPVYDLAQFSNRSKKEIEKAKQQLNYKFYLLVEKITLGKGKITVAGSA